MTPTQIFAYSWITNGAGQGTLYAGADRLPLPILAESPQLRQRIAFAMLLHAFGDEPHAERKAFRLHQQFARRFVATSSWGITAKDFNDTLAACLVDFYQRRLPVRIELEYVGGQRRDTMRDSFAVDRRRPQQRPLQKALSIPEFSPRERLTLLSATTLN